MSQKVRGGHIYLYTGSLKGAGDNNDYWSGTTYPNAAYAYHVHSDNANVDPSHYATRYYGFSVRGGYVRLDTGSLKYANLGSDYWSSTTYSDAIYAFSLGFNSITVSPLDYSYRFYGFPVHHFILLTYPATRIIYMFLTPLQQDSFLETPHFTYAFSLIPRVKGVARL